MQVPGFTVDQTASGRVFRPFTALPEHPSVSLEPADWRDSGNGDTHPDARSLILWESRTPGVTLSMHRRPDGTYSGIFGGRREVFDGIAGAGDVEALLVKAFAGLPQEWAEEMALQVCARPSPSRSHREFSKHECEVAVVLLPLDAVSCALSGAPIPRSCLRSSLLFATCIAKCIVADVARVSGGGRGPQIVRPAAGARVSVLLQC